MLSATILGILFTSGGLALSYAPDLPVGATMIVLAGATYLLALAARGVLTHYQRTKQTGAKARAP
jgi:zinc transport system permease protein